MAGFCILVLAQETRAKDRSGTVTIDVLLNAPSDSQKVSLWIPYPESDPNQDITDVSVAGNYSTSQVHREAKGGNTILYAEWRDPASERRLSYSFRVKRKELVTKAFPRKELGFSPDEFRAYLEPTASAPLEGKIKERASTITNGKHTVLDKAKAIYDWIVENMYRDPNVKGCGYGMVERLLETKGGKRADIHSVFVALARASGIPAREVFGIRLPKGPEGDMTKSQHCWAEFYLPGYGWVVVDPADVRKYILEQKSDLKQAASVRDYYFGTVDENRIAFGSGRDLMLNPRQSAGPLTYFMYPYAEADGKPLNEDLYGFNIGYTIRFRE